MDRKMSIRPVSGFVNESGFFFPTEAAAHRARIRSEIQNLLREGHGVRFGDSKDVFVDWISVDKVVDNRIALMRLLSEYDALGD